MAEEIENALRNSLIRIDRDCSRIKESIYVLLLMTFVFWLAMCFAKDDHKGLPYGMAAIICSVFVAGMKSLQASNDNTRSILKAIEIASRLDIPDSTLPS